ncbi:MAG: hypothetical protein H6Q43_58 [Deltaproteobacteria bacterium]|nr:hypothetical protein [Deltaproteobacteria bacterium]MBP1716620.1 hypothetical protein [Deltaproteobacteria bacterium]
MQVIRNSFRKTDFGEEVPRKSYRGEKAIRDDLRPIPFGIQKSASQDRSGNDEFFQEGRG